MIGSSSPSAFCCGSVFGRCCVGSSSPFASCRGSVFGCCCVSLRQVAVKKLRGENAGELKKEAAKPKEGEGESDSYTYEYETYEESTDEEGEKKKRTEERGTDRSQESSSS